MDRAIRNLVNSKATKTPLSNGAPALRDGTDGDQRLAKVSDGIRLYRKELGKWWFTPLQRSETASLPIASATKVGGIKVGTNLSITTSGVLSASGGGGSGDITGVDLTGGTGISIDSETNTTSGDYSSTITCNLEGTELISTGETGTAKFLRVDGDGTCSWQTPAYVANTDVDVSVANLKTRLAGGFGSNAVTIGDSNDVVTIGGNLAVTGTVPTWNQSTTGNAATVTTNANLTGAVTSVGNATSITAFASNTLSDSSLPTTSGYAGIFKGLSAQSLQFYSLKAGTGITLDKNNGGGEADTYLEISTSGFTTLAYKKIIAQTATGSDPDDSLFILADAAEDTLTIGGGTTGVTTNAVFSTDTIEINVSKDNLFNLSSVGLVKRTGTNTYAIDASSYLTGITKSQVEAVLTGSISSHTHSYDNYGDWNLWVNGSAVKDVTSTNNVKFEAGQGMSLAYGSDVVTITSSSIFNGLTDPNADKIPYWNDSAGIGGWITLDSSLSLSGSTLSASLSSVNRFISVIDDGVTAYTAEDVDNQIKISGGNGINSSASQAGAVVTVILTADFGTGATQVMAGNTLSAQDKTDIGNLSGTNSGDVCTSNHTGAGYSTGAHLAVGTSGGTALEGDTVVTNWSGGSGGLTASTGRTSLELGTMAQQNTGSYATGAHLALGTSSSTAHRGDYGTTAYTYSQVGHLPLAGGTLSGDIIWSDANRSIGDGYANGTKHIYMKQGGAISFGDFSSGNAIGITEGAWDTYGTDSDNISIYYRNYLRLYSNSNVLKTTWDASGNCTVVGTLAASNLSGTNTGDQTITLTGDVTGSGTGSFATVVGNNSHTHDASTISGFSETDHTHSTYLPLVGGTMTGEVIINYATPKLVMIDSDASGTPIAQLNASDGHLVLDADRDDEISSSTLKLRVDNRDVLTLDTSKNATFSGAVTFTNAGTGASNSIWHQSNNYMYITGGSSGLALKNATSETSGIFLTANAIALNATASTFSGSISAKVGYFKPTTTGDVEVLRIDGDSSGNMGFMTIYRNGAILGQIETAYSDINITPKTTEADIKLNWNSAYTKTAIRVDNSTGYVGIGNDDSFSATTQPSHPFHVSVDTTFEGNIYGDSGNSTEIGSYTAGAIKRIRMRQGGEIHFGDTTTSNALGITEGTWDQFSDTDRIGIYYRNELKMYSNDNALKITIDVSGNFNTVADVVAYYSDSRLKDYHGVIENPLDKVMKLNGYYFTENAKAKELGYNNDRMQVGVSAQEIEKVMPELIKSAPINNGNDTDYKTIDYGKLTPLLIEAIKELKMEINELKGMA